MEADYAGFDIADEFVVGYGLDYQGHYRNLPELRVFEPPC
jgi:hypoxanthine phosphoribosyltransferase